MNSGGEMRRKPSLPELLSPAGTFEALIAAVSAGADAVYVGGKSFGARAFAGNFDREELKSAVEYCHLHGVSIYVTVNTLVYDKELAELSDYAAYLYKIGVDAVICADLGAIREIRRRVPNLELHASTQMSVHNTDGAAVAHSLGCTRVVPARELSIEDIRKITDDSPTEIEIFLHGALCVSYSGQCLMSSLVGGRSGNRGECAQPCRLPYNNGKYPLSLKDMSLATHIPEIIESGVASLKIEGRMKSPEYVYGVTKIYRRLLDEGRAATREEVSELEHIFSRGGFTDGYYTRKTEKGMTGIRSERDKEKSRVLQSSSERKFAPERVRVCAEVKIKLGEPSELTLIFGDKKVTAKGPSPSPALNSPLDSSSVSERLSKMGNTFLSLDPCDIKCEIEEGVNLPPSAINALRRDAAALIQSAERGDFDDTSEYKPTFVSRAKNSASRSRTAQFFDVDALIEAYKSDSNILSGFEHVFVGANDFARACGIGADGVYIPPVIFDSQMSEVERLLLSAKASGAKYALVGNLGALKLVEKCGLIPCGDFRLNVTNSLTKEALLSLGICDLILSPELTPPMARDIGGRVITAGRIPLMLTERCFMRENFGCEKCGKAALTDRMGTRFPMVREYPHRNIIFNSAPTYMGDKKDELQRNSLYCEHFVFSTERGVEIINLIKKYNSSQSLGGSVRRMGKRDSK